MVDAAHDKEKSDKETIRRLTEEVTNLTKMAEQQTGFSMDQEQRWATYHPFHDTFLCGHCKISIIMGVVE